MVYCDEIYSKGGEILFKDIKKFFADFINDLRQKRAFRYAPLIAVPCLLAILIPTILAVWHVYFKEDTLFDAHDVSVTLYNDENKIIASETVTESYVEGSFLVNLLTSLNSGKELNAIPDNIASEPNYRIFIDYGDDTVDYDCYFSSSPSTSYLSYGGKYFEVSKEHYEDFLNSGYSEAAYPEATPPVLMTKQGATILPRNTYWQYKKLDGETKRATEIDTVSRIQRFEMSGSVSLEFSKLPDICSVTVTDSEGALIYEGDLDRLSYITATAGSLLHVDITASWARRDDRSAYGFLDYKFDVVCKNYASFDVSASVVRPGEFITLSVLDIEQGSKVIYSAVSEDASNEEQVDGITAQKAIESIKPIFSYSDGNAYAFLPIPYGTPEGEIRFTLSSGAASKEFSVTVIDAPIQNTITLTKSKKVINNAISDTALNEIKRIKMSIEPKNTAKALFRGEFASFDADLTRGYSYGDHFVIDEELNEDFAALGVDYVSSLKDANVGALNIGRVIYTGYALHLGNFVVIDHGMGLATWYCHLSSIDCAVGDVLAKGETLGKCGSSIFLEDSGLLLLCSLNGQFIDPDLISGKKLLENKTQVSGGNNNDVQ